jgi:hypothetical protein
VGVKLRVTGTVEMYYAELGTVGVKLRVAATVEI